MTAAKLCVACIGGTLALLALCYGILHKSADAWRLFLTLVPPLTLFVWWMVDRAVLERRIKRLEARSEITDERRITAQTSLGQVEHRLNEIEGRVVDIEALAVSPDEAQCKLTTSGTGNCPLPCMDSIVIVRQPVNPQ